MERNKYARPKKKKKEIRRLFISLTCHCYSAVLLVLRVAPHYPNSWNRRVEKSIGLLVLHLNSSWQRDCNTLVRSVEAYSATV